MNQHRYSLEKGSKKHRCPECEKKTFVRYIDTETGDYLPEQYGRCDRESKCSYFLNPYLDGYAKAIWEQEQGNRSELPNNWKPQRKKATPEPDPKPVFFDFETFFQTLEPDRYEKNTFLQNLLTRVSFPFDVHDLGKVAGLYRLGTIANGYRSGANTFPFIDVQGNIRAVQVKQFDKQNHSIGNPIPLNRIVENHHTRNNEPLPEWIEAYNKNESTFSCLFGEHLLNKYPSNPVALVEAPKTAIYGTLYFGLPETPDSLLWLAVYNKSSFTSENGFEKIKVLQGRFVYVFPDLSKDGSTFKEWETKAKEYEKRLPKTRFIFSDLLERLATTEQREKGADIADVLILQDWRLFRKKNVQEAPQQPEPEKVTGVTAQQNNIFSLENVFPEISNQQPQDWSNDIAAIEYYFSIIELPTQPIKINSCSTILDCSKYVDSTLSIVKANNGKQTFYTYLNQLKELKNYFENIKNL